MWYKPHREYYADIHYFTVVGSYLLDPKIEFAETLFNLYPTFIPTQALYLDLEGNGSGSEDILSFFWPVLPGDQRFSWIQRSDSSTIDVAKFEAQIKLIGAARAKWIVVFSGGQKLPDERERLVALLGKDPFPASDWINLHYAVRECRGIKSSIRENRNVWYEKDRSRVRYSLEALEWEFGIERPIELRSHSYRYRDLGGEPGLMEVLVSVQQANAGLSTEEEEMYLRKYCEADVNSMYEIAYTCEQLLFPPSERQQRRRLNK